MSIIDSDKPEDDREMTFVAHLEELRIRVMRALWGLIPATAVGWWLKEDMLSLLSRPLVLAWKKLGQAKPSLHYSNIVDPLVIYMQLALVAGVMIASPWIFYQLWAFVSPGLYRREKKLAIPFVLGSTFFFVGGAFFGYMVVFPLGFETFLGMAAPLPNTELQIVPTLMIDEYLKFATRMLLAFGVVFEVPVVVLFLAMAGIVTWRQLLAFGRWWVVAASIIAAVLTPPDVLSQLLMLGPLVFLYFLSVGLAYLFGPKERPEPIEHD